MNPKILVVGGNGFIGSAVCRVALARGMQVTSVSSSGRPYQSAKGHTPAWASKVDWQKGNALHPETFAHLLPGVGGVVHTLGTLIEDGQYKRAVQHGDIPALVGSFFQAASAGIGGGNPLGKPADAEKKLRSYEVLNRDSALRVCEAFLASGGGAQSSTGSSRPFIYISAEDIFRPVISARYIETKREAERRIETMMLEHPGYRGVYIRPSLVYHAHHRPLTTPAAVLLELSASLHARAPRGVPTPSSILRSLGSAFFPRRASDATMTSALDSVANALTIPPIHVDHVAEAVCIALDAGSDVGGVVGVRRMRELIGWAEKGEVVGFSG